MATRTVTNSLRAPASDEPLAYRQVSVQLNAPAFTAGATVEVIRTSYATTGADGVWSIDLDVNADLTPTGTSYTVREAPGVIWTFVVPAGSGPVFLFDCLVDSPTNPNPIVGGGHPIPPGGSTGQVLSKASSADYDAQWAAAAGGGAVSSVAGRTGAVVLSSADLSDVASLAAAAALSAESVSRTSGDAAALQKSANLSDLASASAARTSLGLGTAAVTASTDYDAAGAAAAAQSAAATDATSKAGGAQAYAIQRGNHTGTQTASTISDFATATAAAAAVTANTAAISAETTRATTAEGLAVQKSANLSDLASPSTARTNLGLGTTATSNLRSIRKELSVRGRGVQVAASPPTVVLSAANAATAITGSALRAPLRVNTANNTSTEPIDLTNDPNFSYLGVAQGQYVWGFGNTKTVNLTGTTSSKHWSFSVLSNVYCDKLEIVFVPANAVFSYRLRVDDQWVTDNATTLTGLTIGATYRLLVTFPSVGFRKVQVDMADNGLNGIAVLPAHSTSRVRDAADIPTYISAADSVTAGANTDGTAAGFCRIDSWINYTAEIMGWRNLHNGALASTGFVNAGTEVPLTSRLADIAVAGARIVTYAGLNDVASVGTTMPAAVDTVFSAIVAAGPAEFIVLGCHPMNGNTYANAGYTNVNNLLSSKAAQYGAVFVDPFVVKWVNGTGNYTTPNGSGNADLFVNADGIHPTREGHKYIGRLYADAILAAYQNLQV